MIVLFKCLFRCGVPIWCFCVVVCCFCSFVLRFGVLCYLVALVCFRFEARLLVVVDSDSSWLGVCLILFWVLYCLRESFVVGFVCRGLFCLLRLLLECFSCFVGLHGVTCLVGMLVYLGLVGSYDIWFCDVSFAGSR